jgi:hypothetical protein
VAESVEQKAKPKKKRATPPRKKPTGNQRRTTAQVLRRSMEIVLARDVDMLPWAEIALKFETSESAARKAYLRYNAEIVPLMSAERPPDVAVSYLRMYEGQRRNLAKIATNAESDGDKIAAIRGIVGVIDKEVALRQKLGLLPPDLAELPKLERMEWLLDEVVTVLRGLNAPPEVFTRLRSIMASRTPVIEGHAAIRK